MQGSTDGPVNATNRSAEATLSFPSGVAVGSDGDVYFVEFAGSSINGSLLSPPGQHCATVCPNPPCCLDPFAGIDGSGLNGSLNCGCQSLDYYETSGHRLRVLRRASDCGKWGCGQRRGLMMIAKDNLLGELAAFPWRGFGKKTSIRLPCFFYSCTLLKLCHFAERSR